jgi:hypothetical protein
VSSDLVHGKVLVDLAGDVALEHADDLALRAALLEPALDVGLCARIAAHPCEHGVPNFPDPQPGGGFGSGSLNDINRNSSQFLAAQKDCAAEADAAGMAPPTKAEQEAHATAMLKISECMQTNGFPNLPDPNAEGGFMISNPTSLGIGTPRYAKAAKKCDAPPGPPESGTGV